MEKYLRKCLDSLLIPSIDAVEIFVVNDGSKDTSSAIAHEYADRYPKSIFVIDKENGNYGSCINRGLSEATGKYIKVLDADDSFDTEAFETYFKEITVVDVDLIINDFSTVDSSGSVINNFTQPHVPIGKISSFNDCVENAFIVDNCNMHAIAYKTSNLKAINYQQQEGISYTDQEWIFAPMTTVRDVYYCGVDLYKYLMGREGQTMDAAVLRKSIPSHLKVLHRLVDTYRMQIEFNRLGARNYCYDRLIKLSKAIYHSILFKNYTKDNIDLLIDLDIYIHSSSKELYLSLNDIKEPHLFGLKYISYWRNSKTFNNVFFKSMNFILNKIL
jgi:glycosyltransferase involved in cell wall biosynthesis